MKFKFGLISGRHVFSKIFSLTLLSDNYKDIALMSIEGEKTT